MIHRARRRTGPPARRARGVSLIEIVIVITLVAVMSLLAASAMNGGFKGMQLRSAAKEIASQLRYTRTRAIATGHTQRFVLDVQGHAWQAAEHHGDIPRALQVSFIGAREAQPERGQGALPSADLDIALAVEGEGRRCRLQPRTPAGEQWLARFMLGDGLPA